MIIKRKTYSVGHDVMRLDTSTKELHTDVWCDRQLSRIVPVTVFKRSNLDPKASQLSMPQLKFAIRGVYVARTLVDLKRDKVAPLCVFTDEVYNLVAETVVALLS